MHEKFEFLVARANLATVAIDGMMSAADKAKLDGLPAGAGLTGGGDLSADRTFDVVANIDASIIVNANDIQVGALATDSQHGNRGGGALHANAGVAGAAGFMTLADKTKLDGVGTAAPPGARLVTAGAGLTGGGDLSADRTFDVVANADGSVVVNANDVQVGVLATDAQHGARGGGTQHAAVIAAGASGFMTGADKTKLDGIGTAAPPGTRTITAGAGLTGGGDLSADRTIDVGAGTGITVNANDVAVNQAFTPTWTGLHTHDLGTTPSAAINLSIAAPGVNGTRYSHWISLRATSYDGAPHTSDWSQQAQTSSNDGTLSAFGWARSFDSGAFSTRAYFEDTTADASGARLRVGDGNVGAVAYGNIGDTDTGVIFPADNTWAVATGGVEALRVTSSQDLTMPATTTVTVGANTLISSDKLQAAQLSTLADDSTSVGAEVILKYAIPAGTTGNVDFTVDQKIEILDVHLIKKTAAGGGAGTIQVQTGGGVAITDAMSIDVADKKIVRADTLDDAVNVIAAAGTIRFARTRTASSDESCFAVVRGILRP